MISHQSYNIPSQSIDTSYQIGDEQCSALHVAQYQLNYDHLSQTHLVFLHHSPFTRLHHSHVWYPLLFTNTNSIVLF